VFATTIFLLKVPAALGLSVGVLNVAETAGFTSLGKTTNNPPKGGFLLGLHDIPTWVITPRL
jgi:hypothetical protein